MNKFILKGHRVMLDKPEKKEKPEGKLDLILTPEVEKEQEKELMKEWTHSDTLLRKNGILYCCELIPDAEIIEQ